jgi:hypothetical protein
MKNPSPSHLFSTVALAGSILALACIATAQAAEAGPADSSRRSRNAKANESVRSGTVIAPDGQVAVTSIDRKWDNKSGTGTLNEAAATPDGRIYTREANLTRNADDSITARGTLTDFDGRSFNYTETTRSTASGPVVQGKRVDVEGKVSTYETTTAKAANNQTKRTTVITHADGTRETRVEVLAPAKTVASL